MRELISKLNPREKWILIAGLIVLGILLIHGLVISPYQQNVSSLAQEIDQAKSDLHWMQSEVRKLPAPGSGKSQVNSNGSLANLIDQTVASQKLKTYLTQMTPIGESEMRIRYSAIDFNQLISFIATLKDQGLTVKNLTINSTKDKAKVDSTVVFSRPI